MRTVLTFTVSCLIALAFVGCRSKPRPHASKLRPAPQGNYFEQTASGVPENKLDPELLRPDIRPFTLGPGDKVDIEFILTQENRSSLGDSHTTATVGPDGKIYFNLAAGLDVWGMTLAQARQAIENGLSSYITDPKISLTLREVGSKYVWMLGRLNRPGVYALSGSMTLLEALTLAGGTSRSTSQITTEDLGDLRHSFVMRQGQLLPVDFQRLLKQGDTSQNIVLQPDDFIYVPSTLSQEVYVLGAVRSPRAVPYREQMTLVSAIAGSEGTLKYDFLAHNDGFFTKDAYLSHIAIVRGSLAQPQVAIVDYGAILKGRAPNIRLEPGDIVYVPNSPYRLLKSYVNMIVNTFVTTVAANEGLHAGGGGALGVSLGVGGGGVH
jgi:polysaccharide export outer membrane protein